MWTEEVIKYDVRWSQPAIVGFADKERTQCQGMWQHLEAGRNPQFRASNKTRSSVLQSQEIKFCQ